MGIFDFINTPLAKLFGWMTSLLYEFFGNFGLAIIFLTIIVRGLTMPLNIRSAKSMMKQQTLADKQAAIRRKYPDDKQKQNEEIQKLFTENGVSPLSGCLMPLLTLIFLIPMYYIVREPLRYVTGVSKSNISQMGELLGISGVGSNNIPLITRLTQDGKAFSDMVGKGLIKVQQIPNMKFLGLDLGATPAWLPSKIKTDLSLYLPLLIIPILVLVTTVLQNVIVNATKPDSKQRKEDKERAKNNPAFSAQEEPGAGTAKMITKIMPIIMVVSTFMLPAAFGFYWIAGNLMSMLQQVLTYFMFSKPYEEKKQELMEAKRDLFKKKKALAAENAGGKKGKK